MKAALFGIAFLLFAGCLLLHPVFANEKGLELGSPSPTLLAKLEPYLRIRDARLVGWLSPEQGLLITTRLDEFRQLHAVEMPGGRGSSPILAARAEIFSSATMAGVSS